MGLIRFTSAYWHITGLCHLRSLAGDGDSLVSTLLWQQIPSANAVAQPSITFNTVVCWAALLMRCYVTRPDASGGIATATTVTHHAVNLYVFDST